MVLRTFFAFDSEALVVTDSPDQSLIGDAVINNSDTPNGTEFIFNGAPLREITLDDTGGGRNRFNDDREDDHVIVDGGGLVAAGTEVEAESRVWLRQLDANGDPFGPEIEIFALSKDGQTSDIWGIGLTAPLIPGASYVKVRGSNEGTVRYTDFITCFVRGTRIKTARGTEAVEDLKRGQMVWTKGSGLQPVRWIGHTTTVGEGASSPVVFEAGVLGNSQDLAVSQQHRIWVESAAAELHFGQRAVLVAAKHLIGLPGVRLRTQPQVHYTHFMFDRHQIVRSNGALTESFFLADMALSGLDAGPRAELCALFPDLKAGLADFGETVAPTLTAREARTLKRYMAA